MPHTPQEFYKKMAINGKTQKVGYDGEKRAVNYLKKQGYKIIERNYRTPFGEVDIICKKDDVVAFVEVKTRLTDVFGAPSEAVGRQKQMRYKKCAQFFFAETRHEYLIRFDVIEISKDALNHIISAFEG